ncbi:MAG: hypothetical protein NC914_02390 [Candidatus Omnitrophica bacterium]|nr:hypothetical protein [Candidatus Omnitrophota bacterium]
MKKIAIALIALIFLCSVPGYSLDLMSAFHYNPRTGDKQLDASLRNLNTQAKINPEGFISDLSISYNMPKNNIENLILNMKMNFADAYLTIKIAQLIRKPLDVVVMHYKSNQGRGWGVIAKELGIKPGSDAFHALKQDSWERLEKTKEKNKQGRQSKKEKGKNK